MFKEFFSYNQNLLNAQYDVSEIIEHLLTRGEIREDFIKDIIKNRKRNLIVETGLLSDGNTQSPQCDILIAKNNVHVEPLGSKVCLHVSDCNYVIEVKSNLTGQDLKECNNKAAAIKAMEGENKPLYGIFCYKYTLKKNTLLRRFQYIYDGELMDYELNSNSAIMYQNIDFIMAISNEEEIQKKEIIKKQLFLVKNENDNKYSLFNDYPSIRYFWRLIDGL